MKFPYLPLALASAENITIGLFSDIHLKSDYFPFYSSNQCTLSPGADAA